MLTHTHKERQPGTTSPVRFENLRFTTTALSCCWLTRRDELLHVRDCWGNCRDDAEGVGEVGGHQGCWNDCRLFLTQRWGNSADWQVLLQQQERTTAAVPLFSFLFQRSHAVHVHVETKECRVGGFTCYVYTAINSDLNMVCCLKFY